MLSMGAMLLVAVVSESAARLRGWYDDPNLLHAKATEQACKAQQNIWRQAVVTSLHLPFTSGLLATEVHVRCDGQCSVHEHVALCRPIACFPLLSHPCFCTV